MGRKNGKTALIAALVLAHLIGPEAIRNGEIISAANTTDQAAEVFKFARQMVEASPRLQVKLRVIPSTKRIVCYGNGSVYRAISRDAKSKHGGNPSLVIYDELAQAIDRDLYDVLDTSQGAREEPLMIVISTQSPDPEHVLSQLIDDGLKSNDPTIVCHLYAVPDDVENVFDPKVWPLANPALGDFRLIRDFQAQADKAERSPANEPSFRNLYLNQRISAVAPLIATREWRACAMKTEFAPGEDIFLGLDLSARTDLTALVAVSDGETSRVKSWFWKPEDLVDDHARRDRKPYRKWVLQGDLLTTPGKLVDYRHVATQLGMIAEEYNVLGVAYDRWRIPDFLNAAAEQGVECYKCEGDDQLHPGIRMVPWGQGYRDMAPSIDALEASVLSRSLVHDMNPVLGFCVGNAVSIQDPAGNRKFNKDKARFRIDGAVALAMACGLKSRDGEKEAALTEINSDYSVCA